MLFQRNDSEFRGEKKQSPVISCALIVYSLRFWKDNLEIAVYKNRTEKDNMKPN